MPLGVSVQGTNASLTWQAASDPQTPAAGLSYNVRLGTNTGGGRIISSQSLATGARLVSQPGNAQLRTNLLVKGLVPGRTYFWSVQAVDTAFGASPFAPETSFTVPAAAPPGALGIARHIESFLISGTGTPGFHYGIEVATNLVASPIIWTRLGTAPADENGDFQMLDSSNTGARYYRVLYP